PVYIGRAVDCHTGKCRTRAEHESFELGVDHEHAAAERDVRLVQDLSKVPDDVVRLITCGDRGGVEDVTRVGLRHSRSQDELVGVLGKPGRCGPRVRVHATGRLCAVDVVDVEVENLLLIDQEVLARVRHGVGGRGPACGLVVFNFHVDGAGDLHGVTASRVTLILPVNEV